MVFPDAVAKIFLDASAEERAHRRLKQLESRGVKANFDAIYREIAERDHRDRNRPVAPLRPAEDALVLDSTELSIDEVVNRAASFVEEKLGH